MAHTSSLPKPNPWSVRAGKYSLYHSQNSNLTTVVLDKIPDAPTEGSSSPVPFFHLLERLKTEKREGWRRFEINHGESIADHMYRMSIITMMAPPSLRSRIDMAKCQTMALVHDMAESLVGDLTPMDRVPKPEKSRREAETMDYICTDLLGNVHGGAAGREIREAWQEYEDSKTLDSHFVHDVDKIELLLQMIEYEKAFNAEKDLSEFSGVAQRIVLSEMKTWAQEVLDERVTYWKDKGKKPPKPEIAKTIEEAQDAYYANGTAN